MSALYGRGYLWDTDALRDERRWREREDAALEQERVDACKDVAAPWDPRLAAYKDGRAAA